MARVCLRLCVFLQRARDRWGEALRALRLRAAFLALTALQLVIPPSLGIHYSRDKLGLMDHGSHPLCFTKCGMEHRRRHTAV